MFLQVRLSALLRAGLVLAVLAPATAQAAPEGNRAAKASAARDQRAAKAWVALVVTRITRAEGRADGPAGTVGIRVRIGAEGAVEGAAVDEGSGSAALDARALSAVKAAGPFPPPPKTLLTLEGFTELSFPLEFAPRGR